MGWLGSSSCVHNFGYSGYWWTSSTVSEYADIGHGDQVWMAGNLRTSVYNDGALITGGLNNGDWTRATEGAYAVYPHADIDGLNSDEEVLDAYGAFYNWHAVATGNLCPAGWHVPTDDEWKDLELTLGMDPEEVALTGYRGDDEGGMLKESGLEHWYSPNYGATNITGFTARPGGTRDNYGTFFDIGFNAWFWTSTDFDNMPYSRYLDTDDSGISRINYVDKNYGLSVRCIKDN